MHWSKRALSFVHYECVAGTMNSNSNNRAGLKFHGCELENLPSSRVSSGRSFSRRGSSSTTSTATSRHSRLKFIDPHCFPGSEFLYEMEHFRAWQERFRTPNPNVPDNSVSDCQSQLRSYSQELSQEAHILSNDEFMSLLDSSPQFHRSSQQPAPFFSQPNSFPQTAPTFVPDSQPQIRLTIPDSPADIRSTPEQGSSLQVDKANPPPPEKNSTKKRTTTTKKAPKKAKKGKSKAATEDDSDGEDGGSVRWNDPEVIQLIAFRNEMDDEFRANAKKQGKNTWDKLQGRMIATCEGFCKSSEACRKKWDAVYRQYCTDKRVLAVSGQSRKVTCRFFEEIDQGFNHLANVRKVVHGDSEGGPNLYSPDLNQPIKGQGEGGNVTPGGPPTPTNDPSRPPLLPPQGSNAPKKTNGEQFTSFMTSMITQTTEMVNQNRNMVIQTTSMASDIHENTSVLKDLRLDLARLIEKL